MADSDALRARRSRAHASGDHSLCRPGCGARPAVVPLPGGGGDRVDVGRSLRSLARRLEAAHEADPANSMVARELHSVLRTLAGDPGGSRRMDEVDRIRAEWEAINGPGM